MPVHRVGIFVDMVGLYGRDLVSGIGRYVRTHEPWLVFGDPSHIIASIPDISHWEGDGVIAQAFRPAVRELLSRTGLPVVNVNDHHSEYGYGSVLPDNIAVGRMGARHLLERGFRQLGFCGFTGHGYSQWRAEGFVAEVQAAGYECFRFDGEPPQSPPERWNERRAELAAWVQSLPRPVGIMGCNDARARHVAQVCSEVGVRVPEDLALIGVDNDELACEMNNPLLSSIDLSAEQVGYEAAALLDRLMAGAKPPTAPILIPPTGVVTRRSSDVLAISDPTVAQAVRFIYEHASGPIGVDDVVDSVPLSRRVLERRFRTILNRTIGEEIGAARINRAKQMLVYSDITTPDIAQRCGFNYVQQFNALFKQFTGMTPVAYRRQFRMR